MTGPAILIVDDAPANLKLACLALDGLGFDLRTAADGNEAWQLLSSYTPDLILLDLQLPGLDGFELAKLIRADAKLRHIRIIAVTAYAMKGDRERALEAGCDGYIAKPIDPIALPGQISEYLLRTEVLVSQPAPAPPRAILVIEDNPTTRKMIRVALESDGYRVHETGEASEALKWLARERPRLIAQDLVLPDMDGIELLQQIRAVPRCADIPVLCVSGFHARMDEARAISNGFAALLLKPVDPIQLLEVVRSHLEQHRRASSRPPASGPRVLVVDNDPLQRRLAGFHFAEAGYAVQVVEDAKTALHELERTTPAIIVSDVVMPDMDGFELCLAIRGRPGLAKVPVVLVSSYYMDASDDLLAKQVGASAMIPHSGDWAAALERVKQLLADPPEPTALIEIEEARKVILRRTTAQLDRQIRLNKQLTQQYLLQEAQLSVLAGASAALARDTRADAVLTDVLAVCLDLAGISKGALYLLQNGRLEPKQWIGWSTAEIGELPNFFGYHAVLQRVLETGVVETMPADSMTAEEAQLFLSRAALEGALIVPVAWGNARYGVLLLGTRGSEPGVREPATFARVLGAQIGQALGLADAFERLRAREEELRGLVDSMDLVTVIDRDRRVVALHGRVTETDGVERQSYVGQRFDEVPGVLDGEVHRAAHTRAMNGESLLYEWSFLSGATLRHYQSAVFPLRAASGEVTSIVRVSRDVTEHKLMQAQIMVSDRMVSIGMLAAGVAHEINNPLMVVRGNLELALDGGATIETQDELRDAFEASQRIEAIVRDLRLFSRTESEQQASVDVVSVLESTTRMARNEIRHRARLATSYKPVPPVRGSDSRLGQVFLNLLVNAAQAIPEGQADRNQIEIATDADADHVIVSISDTGSGISKEQAAKLFTPFVTTKAPGVGTGLGLAICQRIVTGLGGTIGFQSEVGLGTTFRVSLPIDREPLVAAKAAAASSSARRRGQVLVVDDDAAICAIARRALSADHAVTAFTDARRALEALTAGATFDVILCDLMMPSIAGPDFYQALVLARPELADRVVFLSGGAFTPAARDFVERMHQRCLEKPFELHKLRALINERVV